MHSLTCAIVTLSDRAYNGIYQDKSTDVASTILTTRGHNVKEKVILPDDHKQLVTTLTRLSDVDNINLIITTGGTGFSKRDITPEATLEVAHRQAQGIAEAIRAFSMQITPKAMLSRGVAVIRGSTIIVNLPGSPKAVNEVLAYILPPLEHGAGILLGLEDN